MSQAPFQVGIAGVQAIEISYRTSPLHLCELGIIAYRVAHARVADRIALRVALGKLGDMTFFLPIDNLCLAGVLIP